MRAHHRRLIVLTVGALSVPAMARAWIVTLPPARNAVFDSGRNRIAITPSGVAAGITQDDVGLGRPSVLAFDVATGRQLWSTELAPSPGTTCCNRFGDLALDGAGDVTAVATVTDAAGVLSILVTKLRHATGEPIWRRELRGAGPDRDLLVGGTAWAVAVDRGGDVIASGRLYDADGRALVAVAKLRGGDGAELWRRQGGSGTAVAVAVDAAGDVLSADLVRENRDTILAVTKLDGRTGGELWSYRDPRPNATQFSSIVVEPSGDAFVGTWYGVTKLAASDGAGVWEQPEAGQTPGLAVHASGDVIAASWSGVIGRLVATRLSLADGAIVWRNDTIEDARSSFRPMGVVSRADGTVVVSFNSADLRPSRNGDSGTAILDGTSGEIKGMQFVAAPTSSIFTDITYGIAVPSDVAADSDGNVATVGVFTTEGRYDAFFAALYSERLPGTVVDLQDSTIDPERRRLVLKLDDARIAVPSVGHGIDPTTVGATLQISNPVSGETATLVLPAANWKRSRSKPPEPSYRYTDRRGEAGPCGKALIQGGRRIKVRCRGSAIGFSLDESRQGRIHVRLDVGGNGPAYCGEFGGDVVRDVSTLGSRTGRFLARNSVPPAACP